MKATLKFLLNIFGISLILAAGFVIALGPIWLAYEFFEPFIEFAWSWFLIIIGVLTFKWCLWLES